MEITRIGIVALESDRMGAKSSVGEGGGSRGTIDSEDDDGSNSGRARMRNEANDSGPADACIDGGGFDALRERER